MKYETIYCCIIDNDIIGFVMCLFQKDKNGICIISITDTELAEQDLNDENETQPKGFVSLPFGQRNTKPKLADTKASVIVFALK